VHQRYSPVPRTNDRTVYGITFRVRSAHRERRRLVLAVTLAEVLLGIYSFFGQYSVG